jgi:hypothetical protein
MQNSKPFVLDTSLGIATVEISNYNREDIFTNQMSFEFYEDEELNVPIDATTITGQVSVFAKPSENAAWQTVGEDLDLSVIINQIVNLIGAAQFYKITCPDSGVDQPNAAFIKIVLQWGLQ